MKPWSERVTNFNAFLIKLVFDKIVDRKLTNHEAMNYASGFLPSEAIAKYIKLKKKIPLPESSDNLNRITDALAKSESKRKQTEYEIKRDILGDGKKSISNKISSIIATSVLSIKYRYQFHKMRKEVVKEIKQIQDYSDKQNIKDRTFNYDELSKHISDKLHKFQIKYSIEIKKREFLSKILEELPKDYHEQAKKYFLENHF